jgi:hypothetical protein
MHPIASGKVRATRQLCTAQWLKRQNSPYFKDIWKLNTDIFAAPRAS